MQQREIFIRALEYDDPDRRAVYLDEACGSDLGLRRDLEELLAAHDRKTPFVLDRPAAGDETTSQRVLEQPGDVIDAYRLDAVLGEGGMGVVFVAEQTKPVCRKVALKVVKPGMDSRQVIARFEAERQALALMSHPHIAKVYDGGVTKQGRPYFVMELVDGVPITQFCDQEELPLKERLDLMVAVCMAVEHAHRKGIVHRDLKPANILVELQDGRPTPKVIDFGIAKGADRRLAGASIHTAFSQVLGTPYYMSPEQARSGGRDIDARSDVYSLGVVLYELLTGTRPFDETSLSTSGLDDLRAMICQHDPPRPSQRVKRLTDETSATVARCRSSRPEHLPDSLRGELDWIVVKALEKDLPRRYQSARELADDLKRYQSDLPVHACPPTAAYRMTKMARRYRTLLCTSLLVAAALVVGLSLAIWQTHRARVAEADAEANYRAAVESTHSLARALYASDMLSATQLHFRGELRQVRQILDRYGASGTFNQSLRGFEWHLLDRLQATPVDRLWQSGGAIRALGMGPDGRWLAAGDSLGWITLIDLSSRRVVARTETPHGQVQGICLASPQRIATCGADGTVCLWQVVHAGSAWSFNFLRRIEMSTAPLFAVAHSRQQQLLWAAGDDCRLYRLPVDRSDEPTVLEPFGTRRIEALAATPDGGVLAGDHSGTLAYFGRAATVPDWTYAQPAMQGCKDLAITATGSNFILGQHSGRVTWFEFGPPPRVASSQLLPANTYAVAIGRNADWAAAGDSGGRVHLLPVEHDPDDIFLQNDDARRRRTRSWKAHDAKVEQVAFATANRDRRSVEVVSAARDGTLCISRPLVQPASFYTPELAAAAFVLLDNQRLLTARRELSFRLLEPGLPTIEEAPSSIDHPKIITARQADQCWLLDSERRLYQFSIPSSEIPPQEAWRTIWKAAPDEAAMEVGVSPNGQRWAVDLRYESPRRHRLAIFRTGDASPLESFPAHTANAIAFSPDSQVLAVVQENNVVLHNAVTGTRRATLTGHRDAIEALAFSPDSRTLASVSHDRSVICWDVANGVARWSSIAHENRATAVAFHPTLPTLATTGEDGIVRFWRTGEVWSEDASRLVGEFPLDRGRPAKMAFSPDGQALVISHRGSGLSVLTASPATPLP